MKNINYGLYMTIFCFYQNILLNINMFKIYIKETMCIKQEISYVIQLIYSKNLFFKVILENQNDEFITPKNYSKYKEIENEIFN